MKRLRIRRVIAATISMLLMFPSAGAFARENTNEQIVFDEAIAAVEQTAEQGTSQSDEQTIDLGTESYGYDSIVEEAEQEQEYRDSTDYVENTVVFSVLDYRKDGEKAVYLNSSNAVCKNHKLKDVTFVLETKKSDAEQKDGYTAYQVFYTATVKTDDIWQVVDALDAEESILTSEPDFIWEKSDQPDMTEISAETLAEEVSTAGWSYTDLNLTDIWNNLTQRTAPGEGVVVAVIDTGVDYNHIDLKANMWVNSGEIAGNGVDDDGNGYIDDIHGINLIDPMKQGDPMDDMGHGTHVAGIIAMTPGNGGGVGVAYGSKIMAVKAGQANGTFASTDIAKAIQYAAVNGADVINMSFGGTGKSKLVEAALEDAFGSCVLVAAAGNGGVPTTDYPLNVPKEDFYPAGYSYVLGVMACDSAGNKAGFSNWDYLKYANCEYEMIAPGVDIFSTLPGNRYARWSGTSMAAPMVSAAAAIIRREYSDRLKYSSRFIMGQLASATGDSVSFYDANLGQFHFYPKLNIEDSLKLTPKPNVNIVDVVFFDGTDISSSNNKDGVVQAGETIDIGFVVKNFWGIAKNISVKVDAKSDAGIDNPYVEFITDQIDFDDEVGTYATVNNGFRYDNEELVGVNNPIRMKISNDAPNGLNITLKFQVSAEDGFDSGYMMYGAYSLAFEVQRGTYLRGTITEDMTLTSDKLWIVDRSVLIPEGVTVNVDPGTQVQFYSVEDGPYAELHLTNITVEGQLSFNGTISRPINVFPCKEREDFAVEIFTQNNGIITADYTQIINPHVIMTRGNHLKLIQNSYLTNKTIVSKGSKNEIIGSDLYASDLIFEKLSNSLILGISNYWDIGIEGAPSILGELDTVLLNKSFARIEMDKFISNNGMGAFSGNRVIRTSGMSSITNSIFLENNINYSRYNAISVLYHGNAENANYLFTSNGILNGSSFEEWMKVFASKCQEDYSTYFNLKGNYWGTVNESLIEKMIVDQYDDATLPRADYSNYLTLDDDMSSIYPFVTEAYVTDSTGEHRLSEVVNSQTVQVHVKFNRDMSQDAKYKPMVSFGPAEPYTDFVVNGDWVSAREWVGTIQIDPFINQGTEYLRIKDAAAADDLWLTTGTDAARFSFDITKSSAEALTLQGSGGSNSNYLNWVQDDYDTLAGYNLYRSTTYDKSIDVSEQGFT